MRNTLTEIFNNNIWVGVFLYYIAIVYKTAIKLYESKKWYFNKVFFIFN